MPRSTSRVLPVGHKSAAIAGSAQPAVPHAWQDTHRRPTAQRPPAIKGQAQAQPASRGAALLQQKGGLAAHSRATTPHAMQMGRGVGGGKGHHRHPSMSPLIVARDHGSQASPLGFVSNYPSCLQSRQFPQPAPCCTALAGAGRVSFPPAEPTPEKSLCTTARTTPLCFSGVPACLPACAHLSILVPAWRPLRHLHEAGIHYSLPLHDLVAVQPACIDSSPQQPQSSSQPVLNQP